jgi:hypothetical protein
MVPWCSQIVLGPIQGVTGYWDIIGYLEYFVKHKDLFKDGKVETGEPSEGQVKGLLVTEPEAKEKKRM